MSGRAVSIGRPVLPQRLVIAFVYAGLFFGIGIYLPFFPIWLAGRGHDASFIAVALAVPVLARLFTQPLGGILADRTGRPRLTLIVYPLLAAVAFVLVIAAPGPLWLLAGLGFAAVFWQPMLPVLDAYAIARRKATGLDYGRTRLWGSVSFIVGNLVAGVMLGWLPGDPIVWMIVAGSLVCALFAARLEEAPVKVSRAEAVPVKLGPVLIIGIGAAALVQSSHGVLFTFASLHWQAEGLSGTVIGLLWALGVAAEVVLFRFATLLTARLGPARLILIGGLSAILRFGAMSFDPPILLLPVLQLLHAGSFACTYVGAVELVARHAPAGRGASLQALSTWASTVCVALATLAAGPLWQWAGSSTFLMSAALGAAGAALAVVAQAMDGARLED